MTFTPADHLGAVSRSLTTTVRDGEELRLLTVTRTFEASTAEVWDALVSPERIPRWFMPVTGDLQVGGRYQLEGNAGGEVLACEPPERLAITWEYGGSVSWVDVTLRPTDDGALLQLDHSAPVDPAMWTQFGPGAVGIGWEQGLIGLSLHLADPAADRPEEGSLAGMDDYVRGSATAWGEAAAAAGDDPDEARAAARRCAAAYLGEE